MNCRCESSENYEIKITNVVNQVKNYESSEKVFPPRWEYFHRGDNIPTTVEMFPPRW